MVSYQSSSLAGIWAHAGSTISGPGASENNGDKHTDRPVTEPVSTEGKPQSPMLIQGDFGQTSKPTVAQHLICKIAMNLSLLLGGQGIK